jgi:hypothetical protein
MLLVTREQMFAILECWLCSAGHPPHCASYHSSHQAGQLARFLGCCTSGCSCTIIFVFSVATIKY